MLLPQANVDKTEALRRTELFSSLPEGVLHEIAGLTTVRRLRRGEMLYSEHDEARGLFIVAEGGLRSIREGADGREQVLSTERSGATLSETSVFGGGQYFSTVLAETPSVVLCIPHGEIRQICEEHPELLWKVAKMLSRRVRLYAELIEILALRNVDQRLALFLLDSWAIARLMRGPPSNLSFRLRVLKSRRALDRCAKLSPDLCPTFTRSS